MRPPSGRARAVRPRAFPFASLRASGRRFHGHARETGGFLEVEESIDEIAHANRIAHVEPENPRGVAERSARTTSDTASPTVMKKRVASGSVSGMRPRRTLAHDRGKALPLLPRNCQIVRPPAGTPVTPWRARASRRAAWSHPYALWIGCLVGRDQHEPRADGGRRRGRRGVPLRSRQAPRPAPAQPSSRAYRRRRGRRRSGAFRGRLSRWPARARRPSATARREGRASVRGSLARY